MFFGTLKAVVIFSTSYMYISELNIFMSLILLAIGKNGLILFLFFNTLCGVSSIRQ